MSDILKIENISKTYGAIKALKNVTLNVPQGCIFGLLGPNGSGKTTMLGILLEVLKADNGSFNWMGQISNKEARTQIGTLLETPNFYHYLSAVKNLEINASIKGRGLDDIERVLEIVRLTPRKHSKFSTYSLGMKQRLAIANALLGKPKVLLLDEPTNGLDPEGIAEIRQLIREVNQQGTTVIIASHLLDEVEKVCTHVAILKKGDLLLSGPVSDVLQSEDRLEVAAIEIEKLLMLLQQTPLVKNITKQEKVLQLTLHDGVSSEDINRYCCKNEIVLNHLLLKKRSLESKFIELTQD